MRYSENYGLYLPEGSDFVTPEQYNDNFETLDGKLQEMEDGLAPKAHTHSFGELTGVAAASHQHGIGDLTGVAAAGHKHAAGDITSGVFAEARIPYIVDWTGLTCIDGPTTLNQNVACGNGLSTQTNFLIPFQAALVARPKRVIAKIGTASNWVVSGVDPITKPDFVLLDMSYVGNKLYGTVSGEFRASGQNADTPGEWVTAPLNGTQWNDAEIFYFSGDERGYKTWNGFGGAAFFKATMADPGNEKHIYGFYVGSFDYDKTGITCKFTPKGSAAGSTTYTKKLTFYAVIYIFA